MRLIDADELINQGYEIVVDCWKYDTCNKSIDIDTIPTAYDIDKVVEELEERKHEICLSDDDLEYYQNGIDEAIEIVKQGGVSDNVCEWKDKELYGYYTSCTEFRVNVGYKDAYWKYCPYCGKKIKVVER